MNKEKESQGKICILHLDSRATCSQDIKAFHYSTWEKVKKADAIRRSHSSSSKYFAVHLPDNFDDTMGYHKDCYKCFTAVHKPNICQDGQEMHHVLRSDIKLQTSSSGVFPSVCLFCGMATRSLGQHKKEQLGNCEELGAGKKIQDAATTLKDEVMMAKIAEIDMIAKEIKYHHTCRRTYLNKAKAVTSKQNIDADNVSPHERAFSILKSHIEESLIEAEGAELLTSLHSRYISELPDENSSYPAASLRDKILQYFPEQLQQCKPSNRKGVIIYSNKLSEETAIRRELFDHSLIVEVAFYPRGRVKEAEKHQDLPETLTPDLLLKGQGDPPEELQTFFKVLYTGSVKEETHDKVSRLTDLVCADVMFAVSRGRFKPGKHLNMGLGIKSMTGSRKVLDVLNHMGHSISYHTAEEIEPVLANDISTRQFATPDGILRLPGLATALGWDNYDVNTETLSGGGTVHDTVGICYQNLPTSVSDQEKDGIDIVDPVHQKQKNDVQGCSPQNRKGWNLTERSPK